MECNKRIRISNEPSLIKNEFAEKFLKIEYDLSLKLGQVIFEQPVFYVYNPLEYAKTLHVNFVKKYFNGLGEKILFLGMNPGPWGMCQTGIPFGESKIVSEWFNIKGTVNRPENEHPSKRIYGLECKRREVSGKKFWELMKEICQVPENFFKHCFVYNLCPLTFLSERGTNLTPVEIKAKNSKKILNICDDALLDIIQQLDIHTVVAIGKYAYDRARVAIKKRNLDHLKINYIPHPSPRSSKISGSWKRITIDKLKEFGLYNLLNENNIS